MAFHRHSGLVDRRLVASSRIPGFSSGRCRRQFILRTFWFLNYPDRHLQKSVKYTFSKGVLRTQGAAHTAALLVASCYFLVDGLDRWCTKSSL